MGHSCPGGSALLTGPLGECLRLSLSLSPYFIGRWLESIVLLETGSHAAQAGFDLTISEDGYELLVLLPQTSLSTG